MVIIIEVFASDVTEQNRRIDTHAPVSDSHGNSSMVPPSERITVLGCCSLTWAEPQRSKSRLMYYRASLMDDDSYTVKADTRERGERLRPAVSRLHFHDIQKNGRKERSVGKMHGCSDCHGFTTDQSPQMGHRM